jgi:hypothetical protein
LLLTDAKVTFVLTARDHSAGIVSPADTELPKRGCRIAAKLPGFEYVDPEACYDMPPRREIRFFKDISLFWIKGRATKCF